MFLMTSFCHLNPRLLHTRHTAHGENPSILHLQRGLEPALRPQLCKALKHLLNFKHMPKSVLLFFPFKKSPESTQLTMNRCLSPIKVNSAFKCRRNLRTCLSVSLNGSPNAKRKGWLCHRLGKSHQNILALQRIFFVRGTLPAPVLKNL